MSALLSRLVSQVFPCLSFGTCVLAESQGFGQSGTKYGRKYGRKYGTSAPPSGIQTPFDVDHVNHSRQRARCHRRLTSHWNINAACSCFASTLPASTLPATLLAHPSPHPPSPCPLLFETFILCLKVLMLRTI
ncbi:hypothetical protein BDR06DRAFT_783855 [Suillus hirtellus]|nr:hypothetical protein BDR06DRAFT_783855 [Suillus hirtellus]